MFYLITILLTVIIWYFYELSKRQTRIVSPGIQLNSKLPHSQEWTLYHNQFSLCSKKIRVCLAEYAINYKAIHIDLIETGRYEKITRDFLAIPPPATVPVLLHNGHPIYESHGQIKFLAEQVDTKNLLVPTDEPLTIIMNKWIKKSSLLGDNSIKDTKATAGHAAAGLTLPIFAAIISHISGHKIIEGLLFHRIKKRAVFFLIIMLRGMRETLGLKPIQAISTESYVSMSDHLDQLELQLLGSAGAWICGKQFTLADIGMMAILERLREGNWLDLLVEPRPTVSRYWAALKTRNSYQKGCRGFDHPLVFKSTKR